MNALHAVHWTEYERGWGSRPDGIQFFDSAETAKNHLAEFMAKRDARSIPDEYSSPSDVTIMEVSKDLYDLVMKNKTFWSNFNTSHAALNYVYNSKDDRALTHLSHCFQGEYKGSCKYGDEDCPAGVGYVDPTIPPVLGGGITPVEWLRSIAEADRKKQANTRADEAEKIANWIEAMVEEDHD
jgi:hypothetical protein